MQSNQFIERVKEEIYRSNSIDYNYKDGKYTFHWDYDENVKEVEITDEKLAEELGESLPWVRGYVHMDKNDFKKGINIKFDTRNVFVPYEDFIEKRVTVWLDGFCTNYSRDGWFSNPLSESFEDWDFNFQPEVEKFQLV